MKRRHKYSRIDRLFENANTRQRPRRTSQQRPYGSRDPRHRLTGSKQELNIPPNRNRQTKARTSPRKYKNKKKAIVAIPRSRLAKQEKSRWEKPKKPLFDVIQQIIEHPKPMARSKSSNLIEVQQSPIFGNSPQNNINVKIISF